MCCQVTSNKEKQINNVASISVSLKHLCPHVVGGAVLVWSHFPDLHAALIRAAPHKSAEDLGRKEKIRSMGTA
jgi:hypothetical protein